MRSKWKGKFITCDYEMFDNTEFYANYDIFNSNFIIPYAFKNNMFSVYKGDKYDFVLTSVLHAGFKLSSFVFTKKIAKIHENNKIQRKRTQKLQLQKKNKTRKSKVKGKPILKKGVKKKNK